MAGCTTSATSAANATPAGIAHVKLGAAVLYHSKLPGGFAQAAVPRVNAALVPASSPQKQMLAAAPASSPQKQMLSAAVPASSPQKHMLSAAAPASSPQKQMLSAAAAAPASSPQKQMISAAAPASARLQKQKQMPSVAAATSPAAPSEAAQVAAPTACSLTKPDIETLTINDTCVDPCRPSMKGQLLEKLCGGRPAVIERMTGPQGGLNMGVWFLKDGSESLVLKMVTGTRLMWCLPTEAEMFVDLAQKHPQLMEDDSISFPIKIFSCVASDKSKQDLIVMRRVQGESFQDIMRRKLDNQEHAGLLDDLTAFGAFLADFHKKHGLQHRDCHVGNVILDEASKRFSLIDVADLGNPRIKCTDVEHFSKGIMSFATRYGEAICKDAKDHFEASYSRCS